MISTSEQAKAAYYSALLPIIGTRLRAGVSRSSGWPPSPGPPTPGRLSGVALAALRHGERRPAASLARLWGRVPATGTAAQAFAQALRTRTPWEDGWTFEAAPTLTEQAYPALRQHLAANPPDLLLGGGDELTLRLLGRLARDLDVPAVLLALGAGNAPARWSLPCCRAMAARAATWTTCCASSASRAC